jgi:septum formation inhibitor-activating ATPase MinD
VKLDEYKLIIDILREIFDFIIIDMPDNLLYQGRLMRAVFEMADATVVVTTPIISAIDNLQHTMAARYSNERAVPIDPKYSILAINKYITPSNQYRKGYAGGSLTMNQIAESLSASFFEVVPISLTEEAAIGSLLDGRDITFKQDIAKLADSVLMLIDYRYDEEDRS